MNGITSRISRMVVRHIKFYSEQEIPEFRVNHGMVQVVVTFPDRLSLGPSNDQEINATYNALSQTVRIRLFVPWEITGYWLSEFIPAFKRGLRHELEHFRQHMRAGLLGSVLKPLLTVHGQIPGQLERGPWTSVGMAARYLLNPLEVEAHVMGIKMEAKTRKVKFHVVLSETVAKINKNLLESEFEIARVIFLVRRVYEIWGFYALKRFPSLRRKKPLTIKVRSVRV